MNVEELAVHLWIGLQNDFQSSLNPSFDLKVGVCRAQISLQPLRFRQLQRLQV